MKSRLNHAFIPPWRVWQTSDSPNLVQHLREILCLRLPFVQEKAAAATETEARHFREQVTSTGIVLVGLGEVVFVGFLMGSVNGELQPAWQVILSLAGVGIVYSVLRLRRLIRRQRRKSGSTGDTEWVSTSGLQKQPGI